MIVFVSLLFDLDEDYHELHNLNPAAPGKSEPAEFERMLGLLNTFLASVNMSQHEETKCAQRDHGGPDAHRAPAYPTASPNRAAIANRAASRCFQLNSTPSRPPTNQHPGHSSTSSLNAATGPVSVMRSVTTSSHARGGAEAPPRSRAEGSAPAGPGAALASRERTPT